MSAAVKDLAAQGWVTKTRDPADSRGQLVTLTTRGRAELVRLRHDNGRLVAERLARTTRTTAELATAVAVLRDLLEDTPEEQETP
jgi:DNA-binding MarR family transcriptional regulator